MNPFLFNPLLLNWKITMQFRIIESGAVVSDYEFRALFANVSFPVEISEETAIEFGTNQVQAVAQPAVTSLQTVEDTGVQLDTDGLWKQTWAVADLSDAAQIASIVAAEEKRQVGEYTRAVQTHMDQAAAKKGYDTIQSAALRAGYPGPFHEEGVVAATWMDSCWAACYIILADVKSGDAEKPTIEELLTQLPAVPVTLMG
jgi:hypothetical protein